jgi:hypothetical protein
MRRFVEEADRGQWTLLPECLDDFIDESNPVRVIDVFVDALDLAEMRFEGVEPAATGRPSYHPSVLLKLYIYGYLNRVQSSRRFERGAGRNVEVMWLRGLFRNLGGRASRPSILCTGHPAVTGNGMARVEVGMSRRVDSESRRGAGGLRLYQPGRGPFSHFSGGLFAHGSDPVG